MNSKYARKIFALALALALSAVATFPTFAKATTASEIFTEPYNATITACNGEEVQLSGELLFIFHTNRDAQDALHTAITLVPNRVTGVGSETGTTYRAVGGDRENYYNLDGIAPITYTNTDMYNLVSQDGSDNLQIKYTFHVTVNANGEISTEVDHFSEMCVG